MCKALHVFFYLFFINLYIFEINGKLRKENKKVKMENIEKVDNIDEVKHNLRNNFSAKNVFLKDEISGTDSESTQKLSEGPTPPDTVLEKGNNSNQGKDNKEESLANPGPKGDEEEKGRSDPNVTGESVNAVSSYYTVESGNITPFGPQQTSSTLVGKEQEGSPQPGGKSLDEGTQVSDSQLGHSVEADSGSQEASTQETGSLEAKAQETNSPEANKLEADSPETSSSNASSSETSATEESSSDASSSETSPSNASSSDASSSETSSSNASLSDASSSETSTSEAGLPEASSSKAEPSEASTQEIGQLEASSPETSTSQTSSSNASSSETSSSNTSSSETSATEESSSETSATEESSSETSPSNASSSETSSSNASLSDASLSDASSSETSTSEAGLPEASSSKAEPSEASTQEVGQLEASSPETSTSQTSPSNASSSETSATEESSSNASTSETSATEESTPKASSSETSSSDASTSDAGPSETSTQEVGQLEAGLTETSTSDAGPSETSTQEVDQLEAGLTEKSTSDAGPSETSTQEVDQLEAGLTETSTSEQSSSEESAEKADSQEVDSKAGISLPTKDEKGTDGEPQKDNEKIMSLELGPSEGEKLAFQTDLEKEQLALHKTQQQERSILSTPGKKDINTVDSSGPKIQTDHQGQQNVTEPSEPQPDEKQPSAGGPLSDHVSTNENTGSDIPSEGYDPNNRSEQKVYLPITDQTEHPTSPTYGRSSDTSEEEIPLADESLERTEETEEDDEGVRKLEDADKEDEVDDQHAKKIQYQKGDNWNTHESINLPRGKIYNTPNEDESVVEKNERKQREQGKNVIEEEYVQKLVEDLLQTGEEEEEEQDEQNSHGKEDKVEGKIEEMLIEKDEIIPPFNDTTFYKYFSPEYEDDSENEKFADELIKTLDTSIDGDTSIVNILEDLEKAMYQFFLHIDTFKNEHFDEFIY
ncbi:merozoite surface protein 3, putative [Plasmodium malariae]|uniref:Merozoite surface protein 3, putative n=1 Tax=Plasmodium malariae TaxID=5858 RepID=A0A1D3JK10_PLAMA|nr:merozoite surface protein 3, putative [Plasmodium malariae]SBT86734.1 merozoite surface protein 3, putative [Plasmodium malariae]